MKRTVSKGILAVGGILLISTPALGQRKFDHIEYFKPRAEGQKKGDHPLKGSVVFDRNKKTVEFLNKKDNSIIGIPTDKISQMFVETKLRLLVPVYQYLLTIKYTDTEGTGKYVAVILNDHNCRDVLIAAAAETGKEVVHKDWGVP